MAETVEDMRDELCGLIAQVVTGWIEAGVDQEQIEDWVTLMEYAYLKGKTDTLKMERGLRLARSAL